MKWPKAAKDKVSHVDRILVITILVLVVVGLMILYSSSAYNGRVKFQDEFYYLKKQLFATSLGLAAMYAMSQMDYHLLRRFSGALYIVSLILSTAVLFIGEEYNGSKRWLSFGPFSFQPSEFAKIAVIIFLSTLLVKYAPYMGKLKADIIMMVSVLPVVGLVGACNLSTAVIILGLSGILVFISSPKYAQFLVLIATAVGFLGVFLGLESYRLERISIWKHPENYEKGYQTLQGLYAIGSGGIFGNGAGGSLQKLGFLPEAQNDMIFSIICEEEGLIGGVLLLVLFALLLWRFFLIAVNAKDLYGGFLASGVMAHMMLQVILNVAVVTNTVPNTGITLPFISYGGTSIVFLLMEMGIMLNISKGSTGEIYG